jgi:dihydroorotate dehydrogenase (NAD+) catalytic subunit
MSWPVKSLGDLTQISLAIALNRLKLRAPTLNASGVLGMSVPLLRRVYDSGVGAVVTKSLGPQARFGHLNPTVVPVEGGILNAMGLPNPGVNYFIDEIQKLKSQNVPVIASFFASTLKEFSESASLLSEAGSDALELNLSCPNVEGEVGMCAADALSVERVTAAVKAVTDKPVLVKLSPNVTDIASIAVAAEKGGADAITATNTLKAMTIDTNFKRPVLMNVTGGLSGPALKPIALRCVWEIFEAVEIPIIGCGGVATGIDAVEYILAGASAVEIGTAVMTRGFEVYGEINEGIRTYLTENGYSKVSELVGGAHHV